MALSLLTNGYLSPELKLKRKVADVLSDSHSPPPDFQGRGVNPPIIFSDSVRRMVIVLVIPSHF
jgi:hypothetical protein